MCLLVITAILLIICLCVIIKESPADSNSKTTEGADCLRKYNRESQRPRHQEEFTKDTNQSVLEYNGKKQSANSVRCDSTT